MAKNYFPGIESLTSIGPEILLDWKWLCQLGVAVTPQVGVVSLKLPHILMSFHRIGQPHVATLVQVGFKKKKKKCGISENKVDGVSSETVPAMESPPGEV
jgi:hypothetical protein